MELEHELKNAIKTNDINKIHAVFDNIYMKYSRLVYFVIMKYVSNKLDVEEITQEVVISFYNNIINIEVSNIKNYLVTAAKNKAIDFLRKNKEIIVYDNSVILEKEDNTQYNIEYEEIINKMKKILNEIEMEIILKHNIDGYTFKDLSAEYHKPISTILSIYNRGLKKFKKGSDYSE